MCIRDSIIGVLTIMIILLAVLGIVVIGALAQSPWGVFSISMTIPIAPVSYTHLRAHETVLDLVCRLLLEKKNTSDHPCNISM